MKNYIMSKEAMDICVDYGMKLILTEKEVINLLRNMTEDEFCKGDFYGVLDGYSARLRNKWQKLDMVNEYHL